MENKIDYKGYVIRIDPDIYAESPDANENADLFLVGFHRNFTVKREDYKKDTVRALLNGMRNEDGTRNEYAHNIAKKYHVFPLEAYIHSGVMLYLGGEARTDRDYDVSALGAVFVQRSIWRTRKQAEAAARALIAEWNQYLSGDVWCVDVQDQDGETLDGSYGGTYGYEDAVQQAKDTIDRLVELDGHRLPFLKRDARAILHERFDRIMDAFKDDERVLVGKALQKAINNL